MSRVDGKIVLITGAASGIGAASAELLARNGATVILTDINRVMGSRLADTLRASGAKAEFLCHDVSSERSWQEIMDALRDRHSGLDVLVNNAGIVLIKPLELTTLEEWHHLSSVNIDGTFLGMKHALPVMRESARDKPHGGSIINMSSVVGIVGVPNALAYSMSKAAIRQMSKSAAMEMAANGDNIRVNSLHPGLIKTPMAEHIYAVWAASGAFGTHDREATEQIMVQQHPLGRHGQAEDIANGVLFLASDDSSYMTGAELVIDGGFMAR